MAASMLVKFNKYWDEIHKILVVVVILDPRYKLDMVDFYADKFGADDSCLESVKGILSNMVLEYQNKLNTEKNLNVSGGVESSMSSATDPDFYRFVNQRKRARVTSVQTELDNYLNEGILPYEEAVEFDILGWWRQNGPKYPVLQAIARDVLAIPITSVASECAFSSGGRLLDPHRSRLHHATVETLMCTRSWLQNDLLQGNLKLNLSLLIV